MRQPDTFVYVDGSCSNKRVGGCGALIISNDGIIHVYTPHVKNVTSSRMEMEGILLALERILPSRVMVHTDQKAVVDRCRNWTQQSQPLPDNISMKDLWERLADQYRRHESIEMVKVKSGQHFFHNVSHDLAAFAAQDAKRGGRA